MPPVIPAIASIAAAVGGAGVYLTGSALIGNALVWGTQAILGYGLTTALTYAANRALTKKATSSALSVSRSQMVKQPLAPLQIVYGQVRVSGPLIYADVSGSSNEYLHLIVALAGHEVNAINDIYLNDEVLTLSGENATGTYSGLVRVKKFLGVAAGERDTDLETESGGQWTSAHLGKGIARLHIRLKWDQDKFPGGIPNFSAVVQGAKVYDTRTATTAYSSNWALCVRDYLVRTDGLGAASSEINVTACDEAANVSDEDVELADASTENRYTVNGVIDTSQSPREVIAALATAGAGVVAYIGGEWVIHAGAYRTPTVTLDENDLRGPISVQTKISRREIFNGVKGVFVSPENQWQPADFPPVVNATYTTEDGGERIWRDVDLPFTTSSATAQRLAKIELERIRQQITVKLPCNLNALKVQVGDVVQVTNTRMGWSAKVFEVVEFTFVPEPQEGGGMALGVDLVLRETASGVWDWNDGEETTIDLAPNTNLLDPRTVVAPSGLTLTSGSTTVFLQEDGTAVPRLKVSWTAPSDQFVQSGGRIRLQYKLDAASTWNDWTRVTGNITEEFITDVLVGQDYVVRIRSENTLRVASAWVTSAAHTIVLGTAAASAPANVTAVAGTGKAVSLDWDDSTAADHAEYGVYRSDTGAGGTYNKIAEVAASRFVDVNVTIGTTYHYKITDINRSEQESSFSSIVAITPVVVPGGSVDSTAPSTPSAPTFVSESAYQSGDGTVFVRITIALPALPTGAVGMNVLYRRSGASGWIVGDQVTAGSTNASIDDLSPGVAYEFAVEAYSFSGAASAISSVLSRTAPNKSTAPSDPTGVTTTSPTLGEDFPPSYEGSTLSPGAWLSWTKPTEKDIRYAEYIVKNPSGGSKPASGDVGTTVPADSLRVPIYTVAAFLGFGAWVRFVDWSGNKSDWVSSGSAAWTVAYGGNMGGQNRATVDIEGGDVIADTASSDYVKTGTLGAASVRAVIARYPINTTVTLTGGSPAEKFNVDLTNRGFTTKPDVASGCVTSDTSLGWRYDWDDGGNSSTNAVIEVYKRDGSNIGASALIRVAFEFVEYD